MKEINAYLSKAEATKSIPLLKMILFINNEKYSMVCNDSIFKLNAKMFQKYNFFLQEYTL